MKFAKNNTDYLLMMKNFLIKYYGEIIVFFVFLVYLSTLSPTLSENDSGELAAVQATLGIAHPSGYPLFSLLGYIWYHIFFFLETIYALNLLNAVLCSLAVLIVIKITFLILSIDNKLPLLYSNTSSQNLEFKNKWIMISSGFSGLTLSFSVTFWIQSSKIEVYSLQCLLYSALMYFVLKVYIKKCSNKNLKTIIVDWWKVFLLIGFSFSNHLMTIFLIPGIIYLYFSKNSFKSTSFKALSILMLFSLSITSLFYISMMFYSNVYPEKAFMYGDPSNLTFLQEYLTGSYFQHLLINGKKTVYEQFLVFISSLSINFNRDKFILGEFSIATIFIILGYLASFFIERKFFYFALISIFFTLFFSLNYGIPDINEYFLLAYLFFAVFAGISIYYLLSYFSNKHSVSFLLFLLSFSVISQSFVNYKNIDRSKNYFFYDYSKSILSSLDSTSLLLTGSWNAIASPSLYLQEHLKIRSDVYVIDKEMLPFPRYKLGLKSKYKNFDSMKSQRNYYITADVFLEDVLSNKLLLNNNEYIIPDVLSYRVVKDNKYYPAPDPNFNIRKSEFPNKIESEMVILIPYTLENRCNYELSHSKFDRAKIYFQKILSDFPEYKLSDKTILRMSELNLL